MSCQGCSGIDRREFLERTIAAMGLTALASCGLATPTAPSISSFTINVSDYPTLVSVGGMAIVDNGSRSGQPIAVARTGSNSYVALSLVCPHRGVMVEILGNGLYCPGHGARFSASGAWTGGQPTSNLSVYSSTYDATAGTIAIG